MRAKRFTHRRRVRLLYEQRRAAHNFSSLKHRDRKKKGKGVSPHSIGLFLRQVWSHFLLRYTTAYSQHECFSASLFLHANIFLNGSPPSLYSPYISDALF